MKRLPASHYLFVWLLFSTTLLADSRVANVSITNLDKNTFRVTIGDSQLDVLIRDKVLLEKKDRLLDWVGYSAQAVQHYYGRFPVDKLLLRIQVTDGNRVRFGQAFGGDSPDGSHTEALTRRPSLEDLHDPLDVHALLAAPELVVHDGRHDGLEGHGHGGDRGRIPPLRPSPRARARLPHPGGPARARGLGERR